MDTCICMAESLYCSSETITTLLFDYTPIQNKSFKKLNKILKKNLPNQTWRVGQIQAV